MSSSKQTEPHVTYLHDLRKQAIWFIETTESVKLWIAQKNRLPVGDDDRTHSPRGPMVLPSTASEAMAGAFNNWSLKVLEENFPKRMSDSHRTHKNPHLHLQKVRTTRRFSVHHQNHVILIRQNLKVRQVGRYQSFILVTPVPAKLFPL